MDPFRDKTPERTRGRRGRPPAAALLLAAVASVGGCEPVARHIMERQALTTGPNGPQTPADVGAPFKTVWMASGPRRLESYVVAAPAACKAAPVILIYHGVQETISLWTHAQKFLYDHCVSSVVFDYTGSGDSSRPARFDAVNDDAVAAYEATRQAFPGARVFVLGHSMGSGPMLQATPHFSAPPAGVIVASPFASVRAFGVRAGGFYGLLARLSPDWWDNVKHVADIQAPLLVVHSDSDTVNPLAEGRLVFDAAHAPKQLVVLHRFGHNALYQDPTIGWWGPVLSFVGA